MHASTRTPRSGSARRATLALLVGLATASFATTVPLATAHAETETESIEAEAKRQLRFARAELEMGLWEPARKSAASALRLDPGLYEALMVQGLALEGAGKVARAEALLRTYIELSGADAGPEAHTALARIMELAVKPARGA